MPLTARGQAVSGDPAWRTRTTWALLALVLLMPLLQAGEFQPWILLTPASIAASTGFLATFLPPVTSAEFLVLVGQATWQTIAIATAGLLFGWILAVPMTLVSTAVLSQSAIGRPMGRGAFFMRQVMRWVLVFLRSVPELVWALLFVRIVGLGPTAGVLAIAITYAGMLGKVYGEILESNDTGPTRALLQNGASRVHAFLYGALPQAAPELVSYTIFRWECAIRSTVIMGFVGAGGLGQQMDVSLKMLAGGEVATMLVVFMMLVGLSDLVSRLARLAMNMPRANDAPRSAVGACIAAALAVLVVLSLYTLDLQWASFLESGALAKMGEFVGGFLPPQSALPFLGRLGDAAIETLAMSLLGTLIAMVAGLLLAIPAASGRGNHGGVQPLRRVARFLLNVARSIPELVWASLWLIAAGLGPLAGTLALAAHTTGVLGRLFADTLENLPPAPARALADNGASRMTVLFYATLPQAMTQLMSYSLYRWENNIRAAAVLGVVGAGGLGQLLYFHLSLFQMNETASVLIAMLAMVLLVDALSHAARRRLTN